jgi:hypothetical protein
MNQQIPSNQDPAGPRLGRVQVRPFELTGWGLRRDVLFGDA